MIKKYVYGDPIETEAVWDHSLAVKEDCSLLSALSLHDGSFCLSLRDEDILYGLGETIRGINKRGWTYTSHNSDNPNSDETQNSIYGSHNFLLVSGRHNIGFFFDLPADITFDTGYTVPDQLIVTPSEMNLTLYVIEPDTEEDTPAAIVRQFRRLIGPSYIPPKWAFGYAQSRWGYPTSADAKEVIRRHKEAGIPLSMLNLDIDHMDAYKDFTWHPENYKDFAELVAYARSEGVHIIPIVDAGIKIEEGYEAYESGKNGGYFCKDADGRDFVVGVWPGKCHLPDVFNEEARRWFGGCYKRLTDLGIDGFWNDMNEPALFYSQQHLKEVFDQLDSYKSTELDINTYFEMLDVVSSIGNRQEDYASFYHRYHGEKICHDRVHNLYGCFLTRAAAEAFPRIAPGKEILLYARASYIGMHRYAGIWQGDNKAWWSHLLLNIKMMPSLNMCGFLYTGADVGGFACDTTEDLMIRWLSFAVFTPLMRNHSAWDTRPQEIYRFKNREIMRGLIRLRYRLIPYLYEIYVHAAQSGEMMFSPLGFLYPQDDIARRIEDQLFVGPDLMIAPIYEQNATGRTVYMPEDMDMIRFRGEEQIARTNYPNGWNYVDMPLGDVCIFVRKGCEFEI